MSSFVPEAPSSYTSTLDEVVVSIFNIVDLLGLFLTVMLIAGRKQSLLPYAAVGLGTSSLCSFNYCNDIDVARLGVRRVAHALFDSSKFQAAFS